ncbi:MAG: amino acid--[acyl-carrier-protein] ligase [Thermoleophilia bacterium]
MHTTHPDGEAEFLTGLLGAGLLIPCDVPGVYGRSATFEAVVAGIDGLAFAEARRDDAEEVRFPPVMSRHDFERSGYLGSFPHLAGSVFGFTGDERSAFELSGRAAAHEDWSEFQGMTDVVLIPASCYPVYPWVASRGPLPDGGRLVDVGGYCFRREPSSDPARMQAFRMHENVRIGDPDVVAAWHAEWQERGARILGGLGLAVDVVPANDPFFGRAGRILASGQHEQQLKMEIVCPISSARPGAVLSVNAHLDHFGTDFGIATKSGGPAHTACIGFGLERVALALFHRHGIDSDNWPERVREQLWPMLEEAP